MGERNKTDLVRLYERARSVKPGKDARKLHRELRKHGDGLFLSVRYPALKYVVAAVVY